MVKKEDVGVFESGGPAWGAGGWGCGVLGAGGRLGLRYCKQSRNTAHDEYQAHQVANWIGGPGWVFGP